MHRSKCQVSFDRPRGRLVYRGTDPDERHWDTHWSERITPDSVKRGDPFVTKWSRKYLPPSSRILDAGCGLANTVWGLHQAGYDAFGIDYAKDTVAAVNRIAPQLQVIEADVRALPFEHASFDGIWSLGVIEHFQEGYDDIVGEMRRVLKPEGLAFVTVPSMSPLRQFKAKLGAYPSFTGDYADFYQFVLSPREVIENFERLGWTIVKRVPRGGFKGLKDESGPLYRLLQSFYDSPGLPARYLRAALNRLLAPVSGHTNLYIFRS